MPILSPYLFSWTRTVRFLASAVLLCCITACGGGGGGNPPSSPPAPVVVMELHYASSPWYTAGKAIGNLSPRLDSSFSTVSFSVENGTLPPGLALSSDGSIAGTPTTAGIFIFTVHASTTSQNARESITATVENAALLSLAYDAPALPLSTAVLPIKPVLDGDTPGLLSSYSLLSGSLPQGMQLNADGSLSGTPTTAGTFIPTIQVNQGTRSAWALLYLLVRPPGRILPRGYFFVQEVACYNMSKYGAISTAAEAETLFSEIESSVNGVEYSVLYPKIRS